MAATVAAYPPRKSRQLRVLRKRVLVYAGLCFYALIAGLPVYWMLITTFKPDQDLYNLRSFPLFFNERGVTMDHVTLLFNRTGFGVWIKNTFLVSAAVVVITLIFAVPAGYALARLRFRGAESLTIGIFMTYLVPTTLLFLPLVKVIAWLGLFDKLGALIVAYPTFTIPFCTWLMAGFFKTIPFEIEEAAMMDGCSRVGAIVRVILPLSLAGMLTVAIFAFTLSMQDFVYALTFVSSSDQKVVNIGVVTELIRGDVFYWGSLMAGALIAGVPVAILYSFFLDYFIKGITGGAVK
ncbi:MAG TPA: carbohydrate ABC transporter permease [Chloroflexota bacterium]|nr:carbohydrate ABC transporter permease [Chloroflexota bacterium]